MISITGFLMTVFWGLVGGLVYLAYRPSGGLHLEEMEEEVSALEESIEKTAWKKLRPRVIANFAITADGKISTRNYTPTGFTGPKDKDRLRKIRSLGDAVTGRGQHRDQRSHEPRPVIAQPCRRIAPRGQSAEPLRVVASNRGQVSTDWKVFHSGSAPRVIFSTRQMPVKTRDALAPLADLWLFEDSQVDLPAACFPSFARNMACEPSFAKAARRFFVPCWKSGPSMNYT